MDNVYNAGSLDAPSAIPIYSGSVRLGASHAEESFLKDENWMDSPLKRKVLASLQEDELTGTSIAPVPGVGKFIDVQPTDFFADAVLWVIDRKVTSGTSDNTCSPDNTCSKAKLSPSSIGPRENPFTSSQWQGQHCLPGDRQGLVRFLLL